MNGLSRSASVLLDRSEVVLSFLNRLMVIYSRSSTVSVHGESPDEIIDRSFKCERQVGNEVGELTPPGNLTCRHKGPTLECGNTMQGHVLNSQSLTV